MGAHRTRTVNPTPPQCTPPSRSLALKGPSNLTHCSKFEIQIKSSDKTKSSIEFFFFPQYIHDLYLSFDFNILFRLFINSLRDRSDDLYGVTCTVHSKEGSSLNIGSSPRSVICVFVYMLDLLESIITTDGVFFILSYYTITYSNPSCRKASHWSLPKRLLHC